MNTLERLTRILAQRYKLDPARLTPEQPLGSLGMVEMLFFIEEEFSVHLPSEGAAFGTLGEAARYIDTLLATQKVAKQPGRELPPAAQPVSRDPGA